MSHAPKRIRQHANAGSDGVTVRERGQRHLRKATTLTIAGAIGLAGITTALASQVPTHHTSARTVSGGVPSSAAAIAAAQQAANNLSASNSYGSNYTSGTSNGYNSGSGGSTYAPSSSQSAPVVSSGGS